MPLIAAPWLKVAGAVLGAALLGRAVAARRTPRSRPPPPAPAPPAPTLRPGSRGPVVRFWRWVVGAADGDEMDALATELTRAWQRDRGLAADGIVGPATWAAAGIAGTVPAPLPTPGPAPAPSPGPPVPIPAPQPPSPGNVFGLADQIPAREGQILGHVERGEIDHEWFPIEWQVAGRSARAHVSRRALAITKDGARLPVSLTYPAAQRAADMLGASLLTTRVADEIRRQAPTVLVPIVRPWFGDGTMARTSRMVEQGAAIDAAVGGAPGLVANEGKDWVLTRRNHPPPAGTGVASPPGTTGSMHNGANFGWYLAGASSRSPGGEHVVQSVGLAHGMGHVDYSQLVRLVRGDVEVDGAPMTLAAALADPATSALFQDEGGTLPAARHPDL